LIDLVRILIIYKFHKKEFKGKLRFYQVSYD